MLKAVKRSLSFIALLVMFLSATAVAADLCTALNGLARKPVHPTVDGFNYDFFADVSKWISTPDCDSSKTSVDWTSDDVDIPTLVYSSNGVYGKGGKAKYHVSGSFSSGSFSVSASVTVQMTVSKGSQSNPITATFGFNVQNIPSDLSGRFAPIWQGSLTTSASSGLGVYDDDLFDGAGPLVTTDCSGSYSPSSTIISQFTKIARLVGDVSQRFRNFEAVPTALSGDVSARLAFPPSSIISTLASSDFHANGSGFVAHAHGECRGSDCGDDASRTLAQLAGADTVCQSPTLVSGTLYGSTHATMSLAGSNDVSILGVRSTIQAVFSCSSSDGYICVSLDTVADPDTTIENRFSLDLFDKDTRAGIAQAKVIPMIVRGRRIGYVSGSSIMTPVETDMFGHGRGGAFVEDVVISDSVTSQFQSAVSDIQNLLSSKYPAVNDVYATMFSSSATSDIVTRYFAQVAHPTSYGLWSFWAEQFNGFAVARDATNNQLLLEINSYIHSEYPYEASDPSVAAMNSVMSTVNSAVKGACGDACSSLTAEPTLSSSCITNSKLTIAVSATVQIPTMSLSSNLALANNARKMIKLIPRKNAIHGPEDVHMEFIAYVDAAVGSQGSTLGEVELMFSSVFDKATMIRGLLVSTVSGVNQPVGMGINGDPFFNTGIESGTLSSYASAFSSASSQVSTKESMTLLSLIQLNDHGNSETISQLLGRLANSLPTSGSTSVMDYFKKVRDFLEGEIENAGVIPFLSLDYDSGMITVDLTYMSVRRIGFEASGVSWSKNIPISRTELTLQLSTRVSFTVNSGANLNFFEISGYSRAQDFALPTRHGMRVGLATSGYCETVVNIPSYSYVVVSFSGSMERGNSFSGVFSGNMSMPDSSTPVDQLFSFTMTEEGRGDYSQEADPSATLAAFGDHFMFPSYIAGHQLSNSIAPLTKPLSEIIDFESSWRDKTAWVFSTEAFPYVFVAPVSLPFPGLVETVNISVNSDKHFNGCQFRILSANSIDDLVSSMTTAVASCGTLSSYVDVSYTVGDNSDYNLVMIPKYAGSLYSFIVTAPEGSQSLMQSQSWAASRVTPDHLSWNDLYDGVYLAILKATSEYSAPQFTSVNAADTGIVDSSRAKFYPTELPTVFFPASWKFHNPPKKIDIDPDFDSGTDGVDVDVTASSAYVEGDVSVSMVFGMSLWCSLGDGSLPMSTSFTSEDGRRYDQVTVPSSPDNTFTFTASAEKRSASSVGSVPPLETWSQTITLTPGKLLLDALVEELPGQLTGLGANMITVERHEDSAYPDNVQALIEFKPYEPDSDTLYVPLEFTLNPTNIVAFGSPSSYTQMKAMTSCPLTKDYKLDVNIQSADNSDDVMSMGLDDTVECSGAVGVAEMSKCGAKLLVQQSFSVSSVNSISLLGDMHNVIADHDRFPDWYNSLADVSSVLTVSNIAFNVSTNTMSDLQNEVISLKKSASVPFGKLKDSIPAFFSADISTDKPTGRALKSLSTTNKKTFCSGLKMTLDKVTNYAASDSMNQIIPFTNQHLAPIYTTLINENIEDCMNSVCDITNDNVNTLSDLCNDLSDRFGIDVCRGTALSDEGLDIPMFMSPGTVFAPVAFQFDTERLTKSDLSTGFGNAGDLLLETNVSANVGMKLVFMQRNTNDNNTEYYAEPELDASKTSFSSRAVVDSQPTVRTSLGSTIVTFDANSLNVNIGVTGGISANSDDIDIDLDGSASFDAQTQNDDSTYTCHVSAKVPVLQHYFHPPPNAWDDTVEFSDHCLQGNFVSSVGDSMEDMTIAHYFEQDPALFFKQFGSGLGKDLFDYLLDFVTDKAIAFLGKNIQAVVSKALDDIVGPAVASEIGNEITEMVYTVIKSGQVPNATDLERIILQTITGILNEVFEDYLTQTINTPEPGGDNYTWQFRFGTTTVKDLKGVDWSCGDHGYADLEFAVQPKLTLDWTADFDITWTKKKGISIQWPVKPAFSGTIKLDGSSLDLSGGLLFLACELTGSAQASGKLSISPSPFDIEFNVAASLSAQGKLGLVSKIRQETKGDKANALGALPYVSAGVEASWQFNWGTQNPKPTTPASFKFTDPQLCLGSLIAEFMQQITREVNRIIKPLDPIFGPDGILLKPIPGISKILGDHCNVLTILEWTCKMFSSSCNVDTVRKLVNVLTDIANDIQKIKNFMALFDDPQGCFDYGYIWKTFKVDWLKDNPTPEDTETNGDIPMTPKEQFNDNIPQAQRSALSDLMHKWAPPTFGVIPHNCVNCTHLNATYGSDGKWGFKLDILEDFPKKFIALLLGSNIPLMSVSFPGASLSYSISWTIPVWPTPYVAVNIHAGATLGFQPPSIALMSDGIIDTVRTGNPSYLFRNLAVCTNTSFATGTLELDGGAEGGISVVIAKVTVNFDITIKFIIEAKVANFGSGDWVTFDSILMQVHNYGFNGAIHFKLQLRGGFKLYLQGCVNLLFWKHCWTIVSWSWDTTLWSWEPNTPVIDSVCTDSGQVNSDTVSFTYNADEPTSAYLNGEVNGFVSLRENGRPTYIITADTVMLMPYNIKDGAAALTHKVSGSSITWSGSSTCSKAYEIVIDGDLARSVTMPSCNQLYGTIKQKGYRTVEQFSISGSGVVPNGHPQISVSELASLTLSDPLYGTKYVFSGTPNCPVTLDTDFGAVVNLTGSAYNYKGELTITGNLRSIYWTVYCDNVQIGTTSITCSSMTVNIPEGVNVIKVASSGSDSVYNRLNLQPVNITITDTPVNRAVEVLGATSLVSVSVPAMKNMQGIVSVVGNSNDDNYMHVDMDTPMDNDIVAVAYPNHLAYNDSDKNDTHILRHANVNIRDYSMKGSEGHKSTLRLIPPESYEKVTINMHGVRNSELRGEVDGCDRGSKVNVNMYNEGTHTLVLGSNGKLGNLQCDLNVATDGWKNDETAVREIVINASLDDRALFYEFNNDHFVISNNENSNDFFRVYTAGLSHVSVYFSQVSATELSVNKFTNDGIEYAFLFPEDSENAGLNSVRIPETHSPIILNGPVLNVVFGDDHGSVDPLGQIGAVVVAPSGSNLMLNSMFAINTTHISINDNCISEKQSDSVSKPSDWFISMMASIGVEYKDNCKILVPQSSNKDDGFSTTVDITTGSGADTLDVVNPAVDVVASMGAGDDVVNWMSPDSNSRLFLQMGDGSDTLIVQSAGPVNVDFGNDGSKDLLNVVCKDVSPNIHDSSIFPIGVRSKSRLEISNWDEMDTIKITRSDVEIPEEHASAEISPNINGANIIYQMSHNTEYSVTKCLNRSSLIFSNSNLGPNRAVNANVKVALAAYDTTCNVAIESALNTNGAALLGVNPKSGQGLPSMIHVVDGALEFGQLSMSLVNVDNFGIDIPATYFIGKGTLLVSGTPANKEMFVNLPSFNTHIESNLKNMVVMTTFGESITVDDLNENNDVMLIALSNPENPLTVEMGTTSMKDLTMVNGCVKSSKTRTLSDWLLTQAKNAGFTLDAQQSCSALFMGIEFLKLTGSTVETVHAGGLNWNTLRSLILPASAENVILEEGSSVGPDSLWTGVTIKDYEFIPTMNNDAFHVRMMGPKGTLTVASPVFAPSATFSVECSDTSVHHVWNVALPDDGKAFANSTRYIYSDINFTSNGKTCSGRINSRVFSNMNTAPSVSLGRGISASVLIQTASPENATAVTRHLSMTRSIDGMNEFIMEPFDKQMREAYVKWDDDYTTALKVHLEDRSENVVHLGANVTNKSPVYLSASVRSGLSFPNLGNHTISFEGVKPAHFNVASHSFDLLGGLNATTNTFCFSACDMCSADTWNQIRVYDNVCSVETADASACSAGAIIHVSQSEVPALLSVSCSQPAWDPSTDGQCAISFNPNGADEKTPTTISRASEVIAGILTVTSAFATVACASVLLSRALVAIAKVDLPDANKWWLSNLMRDFYNDQFSWSSIVLTACVGGITDYDISNWNGSVDGLILEVKSIVFGWLNVCGSAYSPVVINSWLLAIAVVVLRILSGVGNAKDSMNWKRALRFIDPGHAIVSSISLLLLPLAGYAAGAVMSLNAFVGVVTLLAGICTIASIPVGKFNNMTTVRNVASYIAVSLPFLISIIAGAGASRGVILSFIIICTIVLPLCNTFVLWKLYFAGGDSRTKQWKNSLFSTFGLRAASLISGLIFVSTLFFNLSETASGFSYAFWFFWVFLPMVQLIPLVINTKYSNAIPRWDSKSGYASINGETTPLRGSGFDGDSSLRPVGITPEEKAMSDVTSA